MRASAEALPFADDAFDAAMAVLTVHHWPDREAGLAEMRRVARRRIVIVAFDPGPLRDFWMVRDYFPAIAGLHADRISSLAPRRRAARGERRADPDPARLQRPLLRRALGPPGAGARPRRGAADVGLAEPLRGRPPSWAASASPPTSPRAPGTSATATCAQEEALDVGLRLIASCNRLTAQPRGIDRRARAAHRGERRGALGGRRRRPRSGTGWPTSTERDRFDRWLELTFEAARAGTEGPFLTRERASGTAIGSSRYLNVRPHDRVVEIGWTWLNPRAWRTGANVEAKLLMLEHAFETLDCVRVEFKTDARNERSRAALAAIPAQFEGVLRNHMIVPDVGLRDSAYYSVIDSEWPDGARQPAAPSGWRASKVGLAARELAEWNRPRRRTRCTTT